MTLLFQRGYVIGSFPREYSVFLSSSLSLVSLVLTLLLFCTIYRLYSLVALKPLERPSNAVHRPLLLPDTKSDSESHPGLGLRQVVLVFRGRPVVSLSKPYDYREILTIYLVKTALFPRFTPLFP